MNGKGPKRKGDKFQRDTVKSAEAHGMYARQLRNEPGAGDVDVFIDAPDWDVYVQCKAGNTHSVRKALKQAEEGCPPKGLPVVRIKRDREFPFVAMPDWVFWELISPDGWKDGDE